jgi:hypothetical protein
MVCPVCTSGGDHEVARRGDRHQFDCPCCGKFEISSSAMEDIATTARPDQRWLVSAWLQDNSTELLTTQAIRDALGAKRPGLHLRAMRVLRWLNNEVGPGHYFDLHTLGRTRTETPATWLLQQHVVHPTLMRAVAIGWNMSKAETVSLIADVLCDGLGYLKHTDGLYSLSANGLLSLEGLPNEASQVGFCAMWFDGSVRPLFDEVLAPTIRQCGYEALRIDGTEHNGKIDDEIVAAIRSARFLVADFTGHRGGVYYEAGFAHGLGLPVIFTCREDAIDGLHFDVRQYNTILWRDGALPEAAERLKNRILATLGQGPRRP